MTRLLVGGTDQVQLPTDSTGKRSGFVKTSIGGVGTEIYLPTSCLVDDAGNTLDSANATLTVGGTERGLVVRSAGAPFARITDGTNIALVKAASTAAVATDAALVVAVSPNNTIPISAASLPSHAVTNAGTFATQESQILADNAAFTDGTTKVFTTGYILDEVAGAALTENDVAAARVDSKRSQIGVIEDATTRGQRAAVSAAGRLSVDASGVAVPITDNAGSLTVDNAGTFAVQDSQKVVDNAAFTDGTTPVQPLGFIFDEVAGTALTENDIAAPRVDSKRSVVTTLEDGTTRGTRVAVKGASTVPGASDPAVVVSLSPNTNSLFVNQNSPVGIASAWPTKLTDGTNTTAVKAASTAAVAADPAQVVSLSPNSNAPLTAEGTAFSSASRGAGTTTFDLPTNLSARGIQVFTDLTVLGGSSTVTVTIQGKDPTSGKFFTLLVGAAVVSVSSQMLTVYPGLTAAANSVASQVVPRSVRISVTVAVAASTFSIGYALVP